MYGSDVWMIQGCQQLGFTLEPGYAVGIFCELFRQYFDRHVAPSLWSFA